MDHCTAHKWFERVVSHTQKLFREWCGAAGSQNRAAVKAYEAKGIRLEGFRGTFENLKTVQETLVLLRNQDGALLSNSNLLPWMEKLDAEFVLGRGTTRVHVGQHEKRGVHVDRRVHVGGSSGTTCPNPSRVHVGHREDCG